MHIHFYRKCYTKGYSLLEVMVAVVILSIGLVAMGLLQVANVQNSYNAHNRSVAAQESNNLADRIRANLFGYENGLYTAVNAGNRSGLGCSDGSGATQCTPEQIAEDDYIRWSNQLAAVLPEGQGIICIDDGELDDGSPDDPQCSNNGNTVIKVFWRETASFGNAISTDDVENEWQAFGLAVYP